MGDAEGAAKSMNEFVESETGGDIKNLIQSESIHEEVTIFLVFNLVTANRESV